MPLASRKTFHICWTLILLLAGPSTLVRADEWPQWLGPKRDGVWREKGILDRFPESGPRVSWRAPVGAGYSGPAVADGRVFITDRVLSEGIKNPADPFAKSSVAGQERVLCLEESSGKELWMHSYPCEYRISYPAGPRSTPLVAAGKVYTLGAMGDLLCLDCQSGKVQWSVNFPKDFQAELPIWGFAASPLLDGEKLICMVGGPAALVVAFNKDTGKEIWRALKTKELGYCPPMIYEFGGKRQLVIWHPQAINGLDPETGKSLWSQPFAVRAQLSVPTPRKTGDLLFVTSFYNGSILLQITGDDPKIVWKGKSNSEQPSRTDGLHSIMPTPVIKDGYIYGVCSFGELRCLELQSGKRIWQTYAATGGKSRRWANAFLIEQGDHFFLFNEQGDLIIANLTPEGYKELSRAHILEPTNQMVGDRPVVWTHPAFAHQHMFARNDKEIVCVDLSAEGQRSE
jgi:outer membrane protein assembly factor BamB